MNAIANNLNQLKHKLPNHVKLIAVSKTKPAYDILAAYESGHRVFGENKVQELCDKYHELPQDIEWHFIGHLQRNKVKYLVPFVSLIHGVDSFKLLKEINKQGRKIDRKIPVLIQFHIAEESTKFGFSKEEFNEMLAHESFEQLNHISIRGVMGMATNTSDEQKVRSEFKKLNLLFNELKINHFINQVTFTERSMGMSNDYQLAIEEGSTMIRIGSAIFGKRNQ